MRIKTDKESLITYQRISYLEEKLPEDKFLRVHKSFIVAVDKIAALGSNTVKIKDKEIPIGRNYKMNVTKLTTTGQWTPKKIIIICMEKKETLHLSIIKQMTREIFDIHLLFNDSFHH